MLPFHLNLNLKILHPPLVRNRESILTFDVSDRSIFEVKGVCGVFFAFFDGECKVFNIK